MRKILKSVKTLILIFLFSMPVPILAQEDGTGNWIMYFGMNKVSNKFSIHSEVQYRNHTLVPNNIEQLLLRAGLNYHFTAKAFATAGYAYVPSYEYDTEQKAPESIEHRIWQQLILTNLIGRVKFEHRYRIEQRWVNNDFKNRIRYRLMLFVPLNKPKIEKGSLFLGIYDEIFVNTKEDFFDRNRLYGGLGLQINKSTNIHLGVLHQQLSGSAKWYMQFALFFNTDFRKKN